MDDDPLRYDALTGELRARLSGKRVQRLVERRRAVVVEPDLARTSASPIPYADSTPANGWIMTRVMPSASATRHACWPPAPPKQFRV